MTSGLVRGDKDHVTHNAHTRPYTAVYGDPCTPPRHPTHPPAHAIGTCPTPLQRAKFEPADGDKSEPPDHRTQEPGPGKTTMPPTNPRSGGPRREQPGESSMALPPLNACVATYSAACSVRLRVASKEPGYWTPMVSTP